MSFRQTYLRLLAGALLVGSALLASTGAWATKGREAVGMCIDSTATGARCVWDVNDKGEIDICNKNGCVHCPSATEKCEVVSRSGPKPTRSLPEGIEVNTSLGVFKVNADSCMDQLIKPKAGKGSVSARCLSDNVGNKAAAQ